MLIRVPDYYDKFRCLAGECPHSCCEKWEVVVDEDTASRYASVPGALGEKLRAALQRDAEGDFCFPLNGGRCPFLDGENLCEIHRKLGQEATSITCREHPRFTEDYGAFREITLSASCPAANALLLGSREPLRFLETETEEPGEEADEWLEFLLPVRERMLRLLADRTRPLEGRLAALLTYAAAAQDLLDDERIEELEHLPVPAAEGGVQLPAAAWEALEELETLEADWPDLLRQAQRTQAAADEALAERIAVYFAFRYLLKAVNDGDLLGRAQFTVLAVLAVEHLAGVRGLSEALRRFSCEIEHSEDNVEALLESLRMWEELQPGAFLKEENARG